jgi:hypothetical protein
MSGGRQISWLFFKAASEAPKWATKVELLLFQDPADPQPAQIIEILRGDPSCPPPIPIISPYWPV